MALKLFFFLCLIFVLPPFCASSAVQSDLLQGVWVKKDPVPSCLAPHSQNTSRIGNGDSWKDMSTFDRAEHHSLRLFLLVDEKSSQQL